MEWLNRRSKPVIDLLIPRTCVGCGKDGKYICDKCNLFLSEATTIFNRGNLIEVVSIWDYEGLIKKLIYKIKYDGIFDAIDELTEKAFERRDLDVPKDIIITFVPMYFKKERQRGFNQAELIAKKLGQISSIQAILLLEKTKETPSQTGLEKEERIKNVRCAFKIIAEVNCPKNILIVDDIYTSGATLEECARVLKKAGAETIRGFTLAKTA